MHYVVQLYCHFYTFHRFIAKQTFKYYCTMYLFCLMAAVSGLVMTTVMSQSENNFGSPPPLPSKGMYVVNMSVSEKDKQLNFK